VFLSRLFLGTFALFCFASSIASAQITGPTLLSETPLDTSIQNSVGNPVHIDRCRTLEQVYDHVNAPLYAVYVTAHNVSKKTIEAFAFSITPKDTFNAFAGEMTSSLYYVHLAPGELMPEDYNFTDGSKEPSLGSPKWGQVYQVDCSVTQVRFTDGTVYP